MISFVHFLSDQINLGQYHLQKFSFIIQKCREIGYEIHEEVLKVLHELHTAMKTHHSYQTEFRTAESKLQVCSIFLVRQKI